MSSLASPFLDRCRTDVRLQAEFTMLAAYEAQEANRKGDAKAHAAAIEAIKAEGNDLSMVILKYLLAVAWS